MSSRPDEPGAQPHVGATAPAFALPDLDGHVFTLADLRGRHHLVLFFMREFT